MEPTDLTIEVLKGIRDEVRGVRDDLGGQLQGLRGEVRVLSSRIDETNVHVERIERRQVESEVRIATQLVAVVGAVNEVRDVLREELAVRRLVDDHERRLRAIETRDR
jgi:hypothetical protein